MLKIEHLSFVKDESGQPRNFWSVDVENLPPEQQNLMGRAMAYEAIHFMEKHNFPPLLGFIYKDMKGRSSTVEMAFFNEISTLLMFQLNPS